jgi:hypothetical protein
MGPGTAVNPAIAASVIPTQATAKPANTAGKFFFEKEMCM